MKHLKHSYHTRRDATPFAKRSHMRYIVRHCRGLARAGISGADLLRPHCVQFLYSRVPVARPATDGDTLWAWQLWQEVMQSRTKDLSPMR